jgi:hypothetical protein
MFAQFETQLLGHAQQDLLHHLNVDGVGFKGTFLAD